MEGCWSDIAQPRIHESFTRRYLTATLCTLQWTDSLVGQARVIHGLSRFIRNPVILVLLLAKFALRPSGRQGLLVEVAAVRAQVDCLVSCLADSVRLSSPFDSSDVSVEVLGAGGAELRHILGLRQLFLSKDAVSALGCINARSVILGVPRPVGGKKRLGETWL